MSMLLLIGSSPATLLALCGVLTHTHDNYALYGAIGLALSRAMQCGGWRQNVAVFVLVVEVCWLLELSVAWGIGVILLTALATWWMHKQQRDVRNMGVFKASWLQLEQFERDLTIMSCSILLAGALELMSTNLDWDLLPFSTGSSLTAVCILFSTILFAVVCMEALWTLSTLSPGLRYGTYFTVLSLLLGATQWWGGVVPCALLWGQRAIGFVAWVLRFTFRSPGYYEMLLSLYWVALIVPAIVWGYYATVRWRWPRTCNRKIFHALVVAMFMPALSGAAALLLTHAGATTAMVDTDVRYRLFSFLVLALGVASCAFILVEYARLCLLPSRDSAGPSKGSLAGAVRAVEDYMQLFLSSNVSEDGDYAPHRADGGSTDRIDRGDGQGRGRLRRLELSHISLLLGCAAPIWLYSCLLERVNAHPDVSGVSAQDRMVPCVALSLLPYSGLTTLGIGDAAGAVVGKLYGRYRWGTVLPAWIVGEGNQRTMEGSVACFASMVIFSATVLLWQYLSMDASLVSHSGAAQQDGAQHWQAVAWGKAAAAVLLSSGVVTVAEAVATVNDNALLPMLHCTVLLSLQLLLVGSLS